MAPKEVARNKVEAILSETTTPYRYQQFASTMHPIDTLQDNFAVRTGWPDVMMRLAAVLHAKNVHPSRAVVLLPYAQLMQEARAAWADYSKSQDQHSAFVPRFETTMNWVKSMPGFVTSAQDIQMDVALDVLTAAGLLQRAGLAAQQHLLAGRLVEAAWSVAKLAAAQPPANRLAWGADKAKDLGSSMVSEPLVLELAIARIALVWAAASGYPTDSLFDAEPELLVVIDGFQSEALVEALKKQFAERTASIQLKAPAHHGRVALHTAQDLEDEAHLSAACVLAHLQAGRSPVALIAQDRVLTRRVHAMLAGQGVALRDETGWKLSTTRAAATLMALLAAAAWDASTDSVLDWLKNAPAFDAKQVATAETALRKIGCRTWRAVPADQPDIEPVAMQVAALRTLLQAARPLADWLCALRSVLQSTAQWEPLANDVAGMAVLAALHMDQGIEPIQHAISANNPRMGLQDFTTWVNQALESSSFAPPHPPVAQVVILPLSQLLGRPMQAVVLPGCDEIRLSVSPEPPGQWTPAQRALLGLPLRQELADAQRTAWNYALTAPHLDVLWRLSEGGERLMPSGFVQELQLQQPTPLTADIRTGRTVQIKPTPQPMPSGQALAIHKLSASAYEDLRRCPYRFFALRQLKLQEVDELESELGKRDFGNWLHLLLNRFHEALKETPVHDIPAQKAMINVAADEATRSLGLSAEEFLPFAAIWPRVRDGYLDWLATHQASGAVYTEGEVWKNMPLGKLTLVGKIDRIDQMPDGSRVVIDYKTEAQDTTQARINDAGEDTQLAFYAALLEDDLLAAAYVNLGEKKPTKTYEQFEIVELRDDLIGGILSDMEQIADGAKLPALGEGKACEYCAARGLCRKDFWTV